MSIDSSVVDRLYEEVQQAFEDVEADFPEAECGWEIDVARSILDLAEGTEADKDEVWRMFFGNVRRKEG